MYVCVCALALLCKKSQIRKLRKASQKWERKAFLVILLCYCNEIGNGCCVPHALAAALYLVWSTADQPLALTNRKLFYLLLIAVQPNASRAPAVLRPATPPLLAAHKAINWKRAAHSVANPKSPQSRITEKPESQCPTNQLNNANCWRLLFSRD